jgi:hypothetical protein
MMKRPTLSVADPEAFTKAPKDDEPALIGQPMFADFNVEGPDMPVQGMPPLQSTA